MHCGGEGRGTRDVEGMTPTIRVNPSRRRQKVFAPDASVWSKPWRNPSPSVMSIVELRDMLPSSPSSSTQQPTPPPSYEATYRAPASLSVPAVGAGPTGQRMESSKEDLTYLFGSLGGQQQQQPAHAASAAAQEQQHSQHSTGLTTSSLLAPFQLPAGNTSTTTSSVVPTIQQSAAPSVPSSQSQLQLQNNIPPALQAVLSRLEGCMERVGRQMTDLERRMSTLEAVTREILEHQKSLSEQFKHAQMPPAAAAAAAAAASPAYPSTAASVKLAPLVVPPPLSAATAMGATASMSMSGYPSLTTSARSRSEQEEQDRLLAMRLQEELNREVPSGNTKSQHTGGGSGSGSGSGSTGGRSECPICQGSFPLAELEAHVARHFDDELPSRTSGKDSGKQEKEEKKEGFFGWLFAKDKDKDKDKKPDTSTSAASSSRPSNGSQSSRTQTTGGVLNLNTPAVGLPPGGVYATRGLPPGMVAYAAPGQPQLYPVALPGQPQLYPGAQPLVYYASAQPPQQH